ncbi:MAG: HAD family phosphatase [Patescibacteria group bacterium]
MPCAIICDYDGTLVDTETLLELANHDLCAMHGKPYDSKLVRARVMARPDPEYTQGIREVCDIPGPLAEVIEERLAIYFRLQDERGVLPKLGADACLRAWHERQIPIAVASSSSRMHVQHMLKRLGWSELVRAVIGPEDVEQGKPAPDMYLKAAEAVGCAPQDCIAIEDAPAGVASAKSAGMFVIGLLDERYVSALPGADAVVKTWQEVASVVASRM